MKSNPYQLMESALEPGETLLWTGHQHRRTVHSDGFILRFAARVALIGVLATILFVKLTRGEFTFGMILLILAALAGVYSLCNMLIFDPLIRDRAFYGITERHALIVSGSRHPEIRTVGLGNIESLEIKPNSRGHGSIKCYAEFEFSCGKINNKGDKVLQPLFRGVTDVYAVRELLEREVNIQRAARGRDDIETRLW